MCIKYIGKTTLFQLLSGLFVPDSGRIAIMGRDMLRDPVPALAMLGIVFQQPTLDLELSVTGNLLFHAGLHGIARAVARDRIGKELGRLGLAGHGVSCGMGGPHLEAGRANGFKIRGGNAEFLGRVRAHYGRGDGTRFEPHVANDEMKAIVYGEPRLTFFPRVRVERVLMRDRRVIGVVARHLGTGQEAVFLAAQTIDATGEGDVAAGAGCRFRVGREHRTRREPHAGVIHYFRAQDRLLPGSTGHGDRQRGGLPLGCVPLLRLGGACARRKGELGRAALAPARLAGRDAVDLACHAAGRSILRATSCLDGGLLRSGLLPTQDGWWLLESSKPRFHGGRRDRSAACL